MFFFQSSRRRSPLPLSISLALCLPPAPSPAAICQDNEFVSAFFPLHEPAALASLADTWLGLDLPWRLPVEAIRG